MNEINNSSEFKKIEAYLRVRAKGKFSLEPALLKDLVVELKKAAENLNLNIELESFDGSEHHVLMFTSGGAMIGGVVGYMLAYIPGALIGIIVGATLGGLIASVSLSLRCENERMIFEIN